ncbi:hypothetical protein [Agromyces seonyuensis]|uniref:Uncharacterized protein n=1 Tax=Agromyces seonyuensis TaxID=2662446 RepID=A0A6I4P546_9MICO|nr:hypothetical protein [Agromyces seonyuensis]MWB98514.1 hypothetical protein [Agromyces seonyuensis]
MILLAIAVCEIAFWVAIVAGLAARYLFRAPRTGAALLVLAPVIDGVLLVLVAVDLLGGGTASWQHGLAALYIGISIAYGKRMVAWADARFAHRFANGPAPARLNGRAYTAKCWGDVLRTGAAAAIAAGILGGLILLVGDSSRTDALLPFFRILAVVFGIDFVWALSYTIWPKKASAEQPTPAS